MLFASLSEPWARAELAQALTAKMSTETSDATQAQQTWKAPPAGSPCWVEIPARDTQKLKVGSRFCGDSVDFRRLCRRLLGPADDVLCVGILQCHFSVLGMEASPIR